MQKIIPCLRNDFGEEQWKAVAQIIIFGKKKPLQIVSPVLMQYIMFGSSE